VGANKPKPKVVVTIVRFVPVADGGAEVIFIVVERPAPHHANATICARYPTAWL